MNNERPLRKIRPRIPSFTTREEARTRFLQRFPHLKDYLEQEEQEFDMVKQALRERAYIDVDSLDDLVNTNEPYPEAVPVLLEMFPQVNTLGVKETIVRALTVKEARGVAARPLIEEFKRTDAPRTTEEAEQLGLYPLLSYKWTVGNAIGFVATKEDLQEIFALLRDSRHGEARQQLIQALVRLKPEGAIPLLMELLNDPTVALQAINALGKLRAVEARPLIEPFLKHEKSWVRQAAKDAIQRIDKAIATGRRPPLEPA